LLVVCRPLMLPLPENGAALSAASPRIDTEAAPVFTSSAVKSTLAETIVAPLGMSTPVKRRPTACSRVRSNPSSRSLLVRFTAPEESLSSASSPPLEMRRLSATGSAAPVDTWSAGVGSDSLPAASKAETWKLYSVLGARFVSVWLVPVTFVAPPGP
jgi:hypothetical protein